MKGKVLLKRVQSHSKICRATMATCARQAFSIYPSSMKKLCTSSLPSLQCSKSFVAHHDNAHSHELAAPTRPKIIAVTSVLTIILGRRTCLLQSAHKRRQNVPPTWAGNKQVLHNHSHNRLKKNDDAASNSCMYATGQEQGSLGAATRQCNTIEAASVIKITSGWVIQH